MKQDQGRAMLRVEQASSVHWIDWLKIMVEQPSKMASFMAGYTSWAVDLLLGLSAGALTGIAPAVYTGRVRSPSKHPDSRRWKVA